MKLANNVEALELVMDMMGRQSLIHPALIWDGSEVILVDTGLPGQLEEIKEAMTKAGVPFEKLTKIIITHQDIDHIGSLSEILKSAEHKIEVLAHEDDKPYIEGDKQPIKMNPERIAKMMESLPEEQRERLQAIYSAPLAAKVDRTISDGEVLPYNGGITVIFTPGHTPGHISLYLNDSKTLLTADAIVSSDGKLIGPNPNATPDMELAMQSIKKFRQFDIETILCYHGGIVKDNPNKQIADLVSGI